MCLPTRNNFGMKGLNCFDFTQNQNYIVLYLIKTFSKKRKSILGILKPKKQTNEIWECIKTEKAKARLGWYLSNTNKLTTSI